MAIPDAGEPMTPGRCGTSSAGVLHGLLVTGGVSASVDVVPAVTFVQIVSIVTCGVLLDSLAVRSLLVPAPARDVGLRCG
ncbi:hypothetical protein, partial [Streptomyces sp. N502]|uniref:hypothetical protein n=1 Tax=Streptomyces sp. N502 TaxID=2730916 RepID=UPI001488F600